MGENLAQQAFRILRQQDILSSPTNRWLGTLVFRGDHWADVDKATDTDDGGIRDGLVARLVEAVQQLTLRRRRLANNMQRRIAAAPGAIEALKALEKAKDDAR